MGGGFARRGADSIRSHRTCPASAAGRPTVGHPSRHWTVVVRLLPHPQQESDAARAALEGPTRPRRDCCARLTFPERCPRGRSGPSRRRPLLLTGDEVAVAIPSLLALYRRIHTVLSDLAQPPRALPQPQARHQRAARRSVPTRAASAAAAAARSIDVTAVLVQQSCGCFRRATTSG